MKYLPCIGSKSQPVGAPRRRGTWRIEPAIGYRSWVSEDAELRACAHGFKHAPMASSMSSWLQACAHGSGRFMPEREREIRARARDLSDAQGSIQDMGATSANRLRKECPGCGEARRPSRPAPRVQSSGEALDPVSAGSNATAPQAFDFPRRFPGMDSADSADLRGEGRFSALRLYDCTGPPWIRSLTP